jgi:hypothetical protein
MDVIVANPPSVSWMKTNKQDAMRKDTLNVAGFTRRLLCQKRVPPQTRILFDTGFVFTKPSWTKLMVDAPFAAAD